jgi:hypothetical protein
LHHGSSGEKVDTDELFNKTFIVGSSAILGDVDSEAEPLG